MGDDGTLTLSGPAREPDVGAVDALVVLLHGYGADGNDLFGLAEPLSGVLPSAAFVSPNAPQACRSHPIGRQWFPIPFIDGSSEAEMIAGFEQSQTLLQAYLDAELTRRNLGPERLALVGFSQGTMMSLHVGLRRASGPAGIVGFSGRLLQPERLAQEIASRPPVLLVHGDMDPVVPFTDMAAAEAALKPLGVPVRTHASRGVGHGIAPDGLQLAAGFLRLSLSSEAGEAV